MPLYPSVHSLSGDFQAAGHLGLAMNRGQKRHRADAPLFERFKVALHSARMLGAARNDAFRDTSYRIMRDRPADETVAFEDSLNLTQPQPDCIAVNSEPPGGARPVALLFPQCFPQAL